MSASTQTKVIVVKPEKSVLAAFALTFFFGPLGLLYASTLGGIILLILAVFVGIFTFGIGGLITWPVAMVWGVLSALASKRKTPETV